MSGSVWVFYWIINLYELSFEQYFSNKRGYNATKFRPLEPNCGNPFWLGKGKQGQENWFWICGQGF